MSARVRRVLADALALSPDDRAVVAAELAAAPDVPDASVAEAWRREAVRRLRQVQRGEVQTRDGATALKAIRAKLRKKK